MTEESNQRSTTAFDSHGILVKVEPPWTCVPLWRQVGERLVDTDYCLWANLQCRQLLARSDHPLCIVICETSHSLGQEWSLQGKDFIGCLDMLI
jgi:hypothetical protein